VYNNSANTNFTGKTIHFLPSCHSTNTVASELIRNQKAVNGLIVITNEQTAGRGQQGNTWLSAANLNLTFSVIFFPQQLSLRDAFYLNIVSSLAIAKTIEKFLPEKEIFIKWPNDIYVGNKKVCGILIENTLKGESIRSIIMGIGINVNQTTFELPSATSMLHESGHPFSLQEVLNVLCAYIEEYYLKLNNGLKEELFSLYTSNMYAFNTLHAFQDADGDFVGYIRGIEENGTLLMEKASGLRKKYQFKEVRFIIP
jgi:BirA family biotin operon repressor/biotin-[acetyl-CoA-carboxylase] ligase